MRIKQYQLMPTAVAFAREISRIMTLFSVVKVDPAPQPDIKLPPDIVAVSVCVEQQPVLQVMVAVYYCDASDLLRSQKQWHSDIYPDEPQAGAVKRLVRLNLFEVMHRLTGLIPGSWGVLQGVRPTKIVHQLLDKGLHTGAILERMQAGYAVGETKAQLITQIAMRQRPFFRQAQSRQTVSIYIGVPYCPTRCLYCSFPAYVLPSAQEIDVFLAALRRDIQAAAESIRRYQFIVDSVYIGGGTPTSLDSETFAKLLALVQTSFAADNPACEITVEAGRPDSMNDEKLLALKQHGIARVSVNPQTMNEKTLQHIGRNHTVQAIIDMFANMKQIGIPVINMDIIAGLPGETVSDMAYTLHNISDLQPENLTVHTLAIKKGSGLKAGLSGQQLDLLQQSAAPIVTEMLDLAAQWARDRLMQPYYLYRQKYTAGHSENVGYAKPGTECRYNIQVMEERQTIIGIGPAAATKVVDTDSLQLKRAYHAKDVHAYIKRLDEYLDLRNRLLANCYKGESASC